MYLRSQQANTLVFSTILHWAHFFIRKKDLALGEKQVTISFNLYLVVTLVLLRAAVNFFAGKLTIIDNKYIITEINQFIDIKF